MRRKILFIGGSLNQTTMLHKIASQLQGEHDCYFTPYYASGLIGGVSRLGWLDFSILGGKHRRNTENYLAQEKLPVDFGGRSRKYDLAVTCSDLLVQKNIRGSRLILVQEGITLPEGALYQLVRRLSLPRFLANTAATGLSHAYDLFCVASHGYKDLFVRKGVDPHKIAVTGIPNFDNADAYRQNDFPHHGFLLAATSSGRETFQRVDRLGFIQKVKMLAAGQKVIFKLHPNEDLGRAQQEIRRVLPDALIYTEGNVHHMIARCEALVTEFSSVIFTALALSKPIYADFDLERLRPLTPLQNGGTSAQHIASLCLHALEQPIRRAQTSQGAFARMLKPPVQAQGQ